MANSKVTRIVQGKDVEIPVEKVWDSIVKVIRRARVLCSPGNHEYDKERRAALSERLEDLEGFDFHFLQEPV